MNYKLEDTYTAHDWQKTYAIHLQNRKTYGGQLKPISIVVTQEIARCVEVWRELVDFLAKKEKISREEAEKKAIWVTSGVPDKKTEAGKRVLNVYAPRDDKDSAQKRRTENLGLLKQVDEPGSPVEWIVSVSMLTDPSFLRPRQLGSEFSIGWLRVEVVQWFTSRPLVELNGRDALASGRWERGTRAAALAGK